MALMETHYYSFSLKSNVTLNVFVPTPGSKEAIICMNTEAKYNYKDGLPVLYLLHGAYGDGFSWLRYSNIDRYAQDRGIAVVMAGAENSFYQDMKNGKKYFTFFTEELPEFITSLFPVSKKREKTFVAGSSMGGYGAWCLGLRRPDLYGKIASMSGLLDIDSGYKNRTEETPFDYESVFYDLEHLKGSKYDLLALYDKAAKNDQVPKLYQTVGFGDFLYNDNLRVRDSLREKNANLTYEEGEGGHDWDFWDKYIQRILDWLLEE